MGSQHFGIYADGIASAFLSVPDNMLLCLRMGIRPLPGQLSQSNAHLRGPEAPNVRGANRSGCNMPRPLC